MAVVQISRIQLRRGKKNSGTGLPQLASGEMAWAIDTQELYIGNGAVAEGAPAVGNTKILTENDTLLDLADQYQYKLNDTSIQTGLESTSPVERSLQERLDEGAVNAASYGISNTDPTIDQTALIQHAIYNLYLTSTTTNRVNLEFDPGTYKVTGTLYIPSNVRLIGTGVDRTVFNFVKGGLNSNTTFTVSGTSIASAFLYTDKAVSVVTGGGSGARVSIEKTGTGSTYIGSGPSQNTFITLVASGSGYAVGDQIKVLGSLLGGTNGVNDLVITLGRQNPATTNTVFDTTVMFDFINNDSNATLKDSSIDANNQPRNVLMEDFSVTVKNSYISANEFTFFNIDNVIDSEFKNLKIQGKISTDTGLATPTSGAGNSIAFEMLALGTTTSQRNIFENVWVEQCKYAIYSNQDITLNHFNNCYFKKLYQGASLGVSAAGTGPINNTISNSKFETITSYGILVDKGYGNKSRGNSFIAVGGSTTANASSQIKFTTGGNTSVQDNFDRTTSALVSSTANTYLPEVEGKAYTDFTESHSSSLTVYNTSTLAFRLPLNTANGFVVNYVFRSTTYAQLKSGKLYIAVDKDRSTVQLVDEYEYVGNTGQDTRLTFTASMIVAGTAKSIGIYYTNLNGSALVPDVNTFTYSYSIIS
jgi:hypothetical protein